MSPDEQQEYDALGVTEGKLFDVDPQEAKHLYEDASSQVATISLGSGSRPPSRR